MTLFFVDATGVTSLLFAMSSELWVVSKTAHSSRLTAHCKKKSSTAKSQNKLTQILNKIHKIIKNEKVRKNYRVETLTFHFACCKFVGRNKNQVYEL